MTHNELWEKDIPGYEGKYTITKCGKVWSKARRRTVDRRIIGNKYLSQGKMKSGHIIVSLSKNGTSVSYLVHRLVLETFAGPCPDGMECRHLDGDPSNNHISNLKWGTRSENYEDAVEHGTAILGEKGTNAKLKNGEIRGIKFLLVSGQTQKTISQLYGVSQSAISRIKNDKRWKHIH